MPVNDWQFWVVTIVTAVAAAVLWRALRPSKKRRKGQRVELTVEQERVKKTV